MEKISLIIPCKNEVESLGAVLEEVKDNKFVDEIIVVVDSETDNSIPITKKYNCKLIVQKNKGYGSAIVEGFKNAKNNFGCIYNADHSFDPKYFNELIMLSKNNDFIFGSRYKGSGGSDDDDIVTFTGNKIFTFITRFILGIKLSDILVCFVLLLLVNQIIAAIIKINIPNIYENIFIFALRKFSNVFCEFSVSIYLYEFEILGNFFLITSVLYFLIALLIILFKFKYLLTNLG